MCTRDDWFRSPWTLTSVMLLLASCTFALASDVPPGMDMPQGIVARLALILEEFANVLRPIFAALPAIPAEAALALRAVFASSPTGGAGDVLLGVLIFAALVGLPTALIGLWYQNVQQGPPSFHYIWQRVIVQIGVAVGMALISVLCHELLLGQTTLADSFAMALVDFGLRLLLAMMIPAILLRPGEPSLRLLPCDETSVSRIMIRLWLAVGLSIGFIALVPVLLNAGMRWPTAQALALVIGAGAAWLGHSALGHFLAARPDISPRWTRAGTAAAVLFWLLWCYGVVRLDFAFFEAMVIGGSILAMAFVTDRVMRAAKVAADTLEEPKQRVFWFSVSAAILRTSHVIAVLALAVVAARWGAAAFSGTAREARWAAAEAAVINATLTAAVGYCLFEIVNTWIGSVFTRPKVSTMPGEDEDIAPASRLSTVVPLLQGAAGFAILAATGLIAVSKLGIDITPVLAGAGILGLAISFGSQSLVRDVVAGIFYMADDAFRVGEYIEAARLKGTVEKISLRSMRLRHHNGHIHTIAFGQLGFVTNFSRDWVTMKFNLRFHRDTDVDAVRKVTKTLGQELLTDEEYGPEFIQPLKLQGVADIAETALVLRFKFTVLPGKPTVVQRMALKRMLKVFAENGIRFATNAVIVHSGEADSPAERGAAAASAAAAKAAADAPPTHV